MVVTVMAAGACSSDDDDNESARDRLVRETQSVEPEPGGPGKQPELACGTRERVRGHFFSLGPGDRGEKPEDVAGRLLSPELPEVGIQWVKPGRWRATYLRDDGAAVAHLDMHRSQDWVYPTRLISCPVKSPDTKTVALVIGHCWVEPFRLEGREWGLPQADQFGGGGLAPAGVMGTGEARVAGNVVEYRDYGGAELAFLPADRPGVTLEGRGCL